MHSLSCIYEKAGGKEKMNIVQSVENSGRDA